MLSSSYCLALEDNPDYRLQWRKKKKKWSCYFERELPIITSFLGLNFIRILQEKTSVHFWNLLIKHKKLYHITIKETEVKICLLWRFHAFYQYFHAYTQDSQKPEEICLSLKTSKEIKWKKAEVENSEKEKQRHPVWLRIQRDLSNILTRSFLGNTMSALLSLSPEKAFSQETY